MNIHGFCGFGSAIFMAFSTDKTGCAARCLATVVLPCSRGKLFTTLQPSPRHPPTLVTPMSRSQVVSDFESTLLTSFPSVSRLRPPKREGGSKPSKPTSRWEKNLLHTSLTGEPVNLLSQFFRGQRPKARPGYLKPQRQRQGVAK